MSSKHIICVLLLAIATTSAQAEKKLSKEEIKIKLDELNAACETARERRLAPQREKFIEECISKQRKDPDYCQKFYADYGARASTRPPLFLDLPECVEAFEFKTTNKVR